MTRCSGIAPSASAQGRRAPSKALMRAKCGASSRVDSAHAVWATISRSPLPEADECSQREPRTDRRCRLTLILGRTSLSAAGSAVTPCTPRCASRDECHRLTGLDVRPTEDDESSVGTRSACSSRKRRGCSEAHRRDDRRIAPLQSTVNLSHAGHYAWELSKSCGALIDQHPRATRSVATSASIAGLALASRRRIGFVGSRRVQRVVGAPGILRRVSFALASRLRSRSRPFQPPRRSALLEQCRQPRIEPRVRGEHRPGNE